MKLLDSAEVRLLTEIGFLAAAKADTRRAELIFASLELLRPQGVFVYAGLAFAYLNAALYQQCLAVLDRGLLRMESDPDKQVLQAVRALAFNWAGHASESTRALLSAGSHPLAEILRSPVTIHHIQN